MGITDGFNFDSLNADPESAGSQRGAELGDKAKKLRQSGQQFAQSFNASQAEPAAQSALSSLRGQSAGGAIAEGFSSNVNALKSAGQSVAGAVSGIPSSIGGGLDKIRNLLPAGGGIASKLLNGAGLVGSAIGAAGSGVDAYNDLKDGRYIGAGLNALNAGAEAAAGTNGLAAASYWGARGVGAVADQFIPQSGKDAMGRALGGLDGSVTPQDIATQQQAQQFASNPNAYQPMSDGDKALNMAQRGINQRLQENNAAAVAKPVDMTALGGQAAKNAAEGRPYIGADGVIVNPSKPQAAIPATQVASPTSITSGINPGIYQGMGKDVAVDTGRGTFNVISSGGNNYNGPAYAPSQPNQYQSSVNSLIGQLDNGTGGDIGDQVTRGLRNKATLAKINDIGSLSAKANENQIAMGHLGISQQDLGIKKEGNLLHARSNANQERRTDLMDRNTLANTANRATQIENQAEVASDRNITAQNRVGVMSRGVDNQERKTDAQIGKNASLTGGENQAFQKAKEKYLSPTGDGYGKSPADQDIAVEKLRQSYMSRGQAPSITGGLSPRPGAPMAPPAPAGTMPSGNVPVGQSSSPAGKMDVNKALDLVRKGGGRPSDIAEYESTYGVKYPR